MSSNKSHNNNLHHAGIEIDFGDDDDGQTERPSSPRPRRNTNTAAGLLEESIGGVSPTTITERAKKAAPHRKLYLHATTKSQQNRLKTEEKMDQFKVRDVKPDTGDENERDVAVLAGRRLYSHFKSANTRLDKERETTWARREADELKECNFKPEISRYTTELISVSLYRPPQDRFTDKDRHEADRRQIQREREKQERLDKETEECTFAPTLCDESKALAPKARRAREALRRDAEAHLFRSASISRTQSTTTSNRGTIARTTSALKRKGSASRRPSPRKTPSTTTPPSSSKTTPQRRSPQNQMRATSAKNIGDRLYKDSAVSKFRAELLKDLVEEAERGGVNNRKVSPTHAAKYAAKLNSWGARRVKLLEMLRNEVDHRYINASKITATEREELIRRLSEKPEDNAGGKDAPPTHQHSLPQPNQIADGVAFARRRSTSPLGETETNAPQFAPRVSAVSIQMADTSRGNRFGKLFDQLAGKKGELTVGELKGYVENALNKQNGILAVFVHKSNDFVLQKKNFVEMCGAFERQYGPQSWGRPQPVLDTPTFKPSISQKSIDLVKANRSNIADVLHQPSRHDPSLPPPPSPTMESILDGSATVHSETVAPSTTNKKIAPSSSSTPSRATSPTCQRLYLLGLAQMQRRQSLTDAQSQRDVEAVVDSECTFAPKLCERSRHIESNVGRSGSVANQRRGSSSAPTTPTISRRQSSLQAITPRGSIVSSVEGILGSDRGKMGYVPVTSAPQSGRSGSVANNRHHDREENNNNGVTLSVSPLSSSSVSPQVQSAATPRQGQFDSYDYESDGEDIVMQIDRVIMNVPSPHRHTRAKAPSRVHRDPLVSARGTDLDTSAIPTTKRDRKRGPSPSMLRGSVPTASAENSFESAVEMLTRAVYTKVNTTTSSTASTVKHHQSTSSRARTPTHVVRRL